MDLNAIYLTIRQSVPLAAIRTLDRLVPGPIGMLGWNKVPLLTDWAFAYLLQWAALSLLAFAPKHRFFPGLGTVQVTVHQVPRCCVLS